VRSRSLVITLTLVALLGLGASSLLLTSDDTRAPRTGGRRHLSPSSDERIFATNDPVERTCALKPKILVRLWRGFYRKRGGDLNMVPQAPNYSGGFAVPGHTGPWDYLQKVPLVLYGPRRIRARGELSRHANITDVFPTVGALTGVGLEPRDGRVLREALVDSTEGTPKVVVTIVWDGVGRNVLEEWSDRWPNLRALTEGGTSYVNATVGSSPSITPATHANLGTGSWPRGHGITAINMRADDGTMTTAIKDRNPKDLELTTYADEIDRALGNEPVVGMVAWKSWHMGMLGHGTGVPGGDADQLGLFGFEEGDITGRPPLFATPSYLPGFPGLERHASELDREDGKADGEWMGHELLELHADPAWVRYQGDVVLEMLAREGYGADDVTDLFFANFKPTDIVGHQYTMESDEMGAVVEAQDAELGRIVNYLDREVGDYVIVVTADHGHTRPSDSTGGWPVVIRELRDDINRHFDVPNARSLIETTSPAGLFFDYETIEELEVSPAAMAEFVNGYTIADNWPRAELPREFADRGAENVFSAAFLDSDLPAIMRCAFGSTTPPPGVEG
jgi:hypothetical protein